MRPAVAEETEAGNDKMIEPSTYVDSGRWPSRSQPWRSLGPSCRLCNCLAGSPPASEIFLGIGSVRATVSCRMKALSPIRA
jgi:hypothetical protein